MVSIVVPVYNSQRTLKRCVESLIAQEYENIEIILVDDGSNDDSPKMCDILAEKDTRIKVIHKVNGGVSSARNVGIDIAQGEYIMFCDSDDVVESDWCLELRRCMEYYPEYLAVCGIDKIWDGSGEKREYQLLESSDGNADISSEGYFLYKAEKLLYLNSKWILHSPTNKIYKTDIIKKHNIRFDEKISNGEDAVFNFKYISCDTGKVAFVNKCLYTYMFSSQDGLSKNTALRGGIAVALHYKKFREMIYNIKNANISVSEIADYYFDLFMESVKAYSTDSTMFFLKKIKKIRQIISLPEYKDCLKCVANKDRIVKIARKKWIFIFYMVIKG